MDEFVLASAEQMMQNLQGTWRLQLLADAMMVVPMDMVWKIHSDHGMAKLFDELRCHWAYYVVRDGRTGELCKIELDEVHKEEYKVGWADGKDELDEGV
jgi:hypothetical protein